MAGSVADAAAFSPNGIKTLLANGLSTFSINPIQDGWAKRPPSNSFSLVTSTNIEIKSF